ncbi:post-gpi attachment to protein factor 3 [Anaeramoeba ignava]|uniref:Post-GPI attachment to proteins factor 3 n=1 Tax=Anaeramoeba ignava TaxID=1746090 RepID=A0A9Q0LMK8_ANAIG|nr:post-gpi attachment to protein factor 3 [Anaeramoeba ignava]
MNSIVWILLFTSSTMFHARDNVITEFSDYHFAFGSPFYWVYLMFLFDYAFHMKLCTFSIVTSFSIWLIWCIFTFRKYKHCFWILLFYGSIFAFSPFELFDFPPLFGHFDAHSLWHAANCLIVLSLTPFIIKDANFYLVKSSFQTK